MNLLVILSYYHPHWTGLTAHAQQVAEGMAARGHGVTVLTVRHERLLPAEETVNGVRIVRVKPIARVSRGMIAPTFPAAAARLIPAHDIVQIHTPLLESLLVTLLCRRARRPLVLSHHGDLVLPAGVTNRIIERVVSGFMSQAGRLADRVTAYSRDYAEHSDFLASLHPKLSYIYPPVELPRPDRDEAARWRSELGLESRRLVGFAGRFVEEKGFDYLLRAIPHLVAAEPAVHLVYAGDHRVVYERFYERCRPLLSAHADRISFVGLLRDRGRMASFYAMCDAFALPSRTDCLGLVQIEAMLCGAPVVASDIPGAREPVRLTGMGRLVAACDPEALAAGLIAVLSDPARYRRASKEIRARFSVERTLDEYERLFAACLGYVTEASPAPPPVRSVTGGPSLGALTSSPHRAHETRGAGRLGADGADCAAGSLGEADTRVVDRQLANEVDMAFRRRARALLGYLDLGHGERVFDCGCGMGFYLMAMAKLRRLRLFGLDESRDRLRSASREAGPAALVQGDIERLPLRSASVAKVLMSEVLEHLTDDRAALREVHRILEPGGVVAISVPHADYPFLWDPVSRLWSLLGGRPIRRGPLVGIWTGHRRLYWPADLARRVVDAGLAIERLEEATHYCFPLEHFLVYGIGKPLFERGLLPRALRRSADRFAGERNSGSRLDPLNWVRSVFRAIDRLNERPAAARKRTFVNVLVKARKPLS
jgi:glycosyltransferase involved in cell wall biosynthesis/SAM-dependent methyltransferase